jgi:phosphate butyryltransferase
MRNFEELRTAAKGRGKVRVAVAAAQDREVMEAVQAATRAGLIEAILVGDEAIIRPWAEELGITARIVPEPDLAKASLLAAGLVRDGEAQVLMKGLVNSAIFLKAALDPERGLRTGRQLSHLAALETPGRPKLEFLTDGGMNIAPGLAEKRQILGNALVALARMGIANPKVAVLCANEQVSPKMPATVDAQALVEDWEAGMFPACVVEGPIALDVALSPEAARHKGIESQVSGDVDLFLVPSIEAGNLMAKGMVYYAKAKFAGVILGASHPMVLVSRADPAEAKLNALAMAALVAGG